METSRDVLTPENETDQLKAENRRLAAELRAAKREIIQRERMIAALESNFTIKLNMFRSLASENKRQKNFLTHMMKNSVSFLILLNEDLSVAYCSDTFLRQVGAEFFEQVDGKNIDDLYSAFAEPELLTQLKSEISLALKSGTVSRIDAVVGEGNGRRAYRVTHTPILLDQGLCGLFIDWIDTTDITNAKNEAERANRSKSRFLATVSHEIRTPMNVILGITQIQRQRDDLPDDYAEAFDKIYTAGSNLLGIINDILDMSKIETGNMELNPLRYDVPSLINDTVQLNMVRIGSSPIEFILDIDERLPSCLYGDELRLKQIFNNLLSNAIKYTKKGHVKLSVSHSLCGEDVMLHIAVEDTGQGMKQEDQARVFTEYQRFNAKTNRETEGTGLGLNITKKLVEMMDGTIEFESEYGQGSIFTVIVKQKAVECAAIGPELAEQLRNYTFLGERFTSKSQIIYEPMPYGKALVVDDVETNLYVARGLLSPYKLVVETTSNGFAVIDKIKDGQTYDIIFMDHMMPQMDGIETTQKLRELDYTGIIVALTANALVGNDELFRQNGFDGFIPKPIDIRRLDEVLNKFVRDRHPEEAKKYKPVNGVPINKTVITPKLIQIFCRDAEKAVGTLRETVMNGDIKLFTTTAHAMKSALANVGETSASESAFSLEKAGQKGDMEFIVDNTERFIETLESLIKKLIPAAPSHANDAEISEDIAFLTDQLIAIRDACDDYDDTAAYALFDQLKKRLWKSKTLAALEEMRDALFLHSDFEGVSEQIGVVLEDISQ